MITPTTTIAELAEILRRSHAGVAVRAQWNPVDWHAEASAGDGPVRIAEHVDLAAAISAALAKAGAR